MFKNQITPTKFLFLFVLSALALPSFHAQAQMREPAALELNCKTIPELFRAYLARHYSVRKFDDELKNKVVDQYLKFIDPSRSFFIEPEVADVKNTIRKTFETMGNDDCSGLFTIHKKIVEKAKEIEAFVKKFVDAKYRLDESVELTVDPDKRGFAKTADARNELIKKLVHFRVSNYLTSDVKLPEAKTKLIHSYELMTKRLSERKEQEIYSNLADAFATALDPHSGYYSKEDLEDFQINMRLSLEGIGAQLSSQDGITVIEEIIAGGAADREGTLKAKDKIMAVSQEGQKPVSVMDMDLKDVVRLIRGKKGTKVILSILRQEGDSSKRLEVKIVRDKIDLKDQQAKLSDIQSVKLPSGKSAKIAILDLPSFYGDTTSRGPNKRSSYEDMKAALKQAKEKGVTGLVLDLSRNGGGLLDDAIKISGLFINSGGVVGTKDSNQKVEVKTDPDSSIQFSGPVVVLISRRSASASEILSGALKDYKRAVIVGDEHTFGKGTIQQVIDLPPDLGALKITNGMFFMPGGVSTQHAGVLSDIQIPSPYNLDEYGEKSLPHSLPVQKIDAFIGQAANTEAPEARWKLVNADTLKLLTQKSKERVAKNPKFAEILKELEEAKKNKGVVRLAEARKKAADEQKKSKKDEKKSQAQKIKDQDAPQREEALKILEDLIEAQNSTAPAKT